MMDRKTGGAKLALMLSVAILAGCASAPGVTGPTPLAEADANLLRVAQEVKTEMARINQIGAIGSVPEVVDSRQAPAEFERIASIDYDGDIEGFIRDLKASGLYEVRITGKRPSQDLPVSLHHYRQPMWKILEDAGVQLGRFATIGLKSGTVILTYAGIN